MIKVDENDPVGEVSLSFPHRDVQIQRGVDPKDLYSLESEIGRGKFGTVYRCTEKSTGLSLAAKFIGCPKKEDRRNVEREIDIMRALQHPRLIQIYDAFENGKVMTVILELIEGGELFERVIDDDFILTEKSCTIFMRQICEGVAFIHKQRILHLDMKPENILCLTKTGNRIKIIDFGLARKFDPDKKLQVLFGTPEFVAPEVVNFDEIGYGTDMWSVGVICYVLGRLSAEQCLSHCWLRRKQKVPRTPSMEVTKDNLKQFVERWNDHPNSPYVFEITSHIISPSMIPAGGRSLSDSSQSLLGDSPSPCGSLASSPGSDNAFTTNVSELLPPPVEHFRRASDSAGVVKTQDTAERINLAEEIRKLSDKLFQLSNFDTSLTNSQCPFDGEVSKSVPITITGVKHKHDEAPGIPWRRTKFKMNSCSRDVPLAARNIHKQSGSQFSTKINNLTSPNGTKDLLLQLLEHWDGPTVPRMNNRHGSISSEWTERDTLGQRTISSINTFFQSRATSKKITPFHFNKS
nr:myosin light chain kinase, smooth muscle-like [Leptinotarsa decemlineata]